MAPLKKHLQVYQEACTVQINTKYAVLSRQPFNKCGCTSGSKVWLTDPNLTQQQTK